MKAAHRISSHLTYVLTSSILLALAGLMAFGQTNPPPPNYDQLVGRGTALLNEGKLREAYENALSAANSDANRFEAYALAAFILDKQGAFAKANEILDEALARAPVEKKDQLRQFQSQLAAKVGAPAAPAQKALSPEVRRKLNVLAVVIEEADKAQIPDERRKLLAEFLEKSDEYLKLQPDDLKIWLIRAAAAVELDEAQAGWEAGKKLKELGAEESEDARTQKILAMLDRKGYLGEKQPVSKRELEQIAERAVETLTAQLQGATVVVDGKNSGGERQRVTLFKFAPQITRLGKALEIRSEWRDQSAVGRFHRQKITIPYAALEPNNIEATGTSLTLRTADSALAVRYEVELPKDEATQLQCTSLVVSHDVDKSFEPARLALLQMGQTAKGNIANGVLMATPAGKGLLGSSAPASVSEYKPSGESGVLTRENSLGMRFVPVAGTTVLFSVWETRVQDYKAYARSAPDMNSSWSRPNFAQNELHPVVNVSWEDARAFCKWLTEKERREGGLKAGEEYRLPTDEEWSAAVGLNAERGPSPKERDEGVKNVYPWGSQWPPPKGAGNYASSLNVDSSDFTSPVGSFSANAFGLFDLGGNVSEWCADYYNGSSGERLLRGASWPFFVPGFLLSSHRDSNPSNDRNNSVGFRVVLGGASTRNAYTDVPHVDDAAHPKADFSHAPSNVETDAPGGMEKRPLRTNSLGMRFAPVPGTSVLFSIWETRVQDYKAYARAVPGVNSSWGGAGFSQTDLHPVVNVSWGDAQAFCKWLTEKERREGGLKGGEEYRLPTDLEWSTAVCLSDERGTNPKERNQGVKNVYPWGAQWPPPRGAGNYDSYSSSSLGTDAFDQTSPVGSFNAGTFGLFDLGGNVFEWCEDYFEGTSGVRVLRGASWFNSVPDHLLSSRRSSGSPDNRARFIGFRVVLEGASAW